MVYQEKNYAATTDAANSLPIHNWDCRKSSLRLSSSCFGKRKKKEDRHGNAG